MGNKKLKMKNLKFKIISTQSVILIPNTRNKDLADYPLRFFAFAQNDIMWSIKKLMLKASKVKIGFTPSFIIFHFEFLIREAL